MFSKVETVTGGGYTVTDNGVEVVAETYLVSPRVELTAGEVPPNVTGGQGVSLTDYTFRGPDVTVVVVNLTDSSCYLSCYFC